MLVFYHVIIQLVVFYHVFMFIFSGWWYINPSENLMEFVNLVRQLGLLFPIYGKSHNPVMFQSTNQIISPLNHPLILRFIH